ncbi:MAG: hypothetical protein HC807_01800 [Gammaproteobacteria bacterium]|nr:hypothetical protein [Gammaproteobacteria bacterium]
MQPTTSPITDRTVTITRKHARRPHPVTHRATPQPQYRQGQTKSRQPDEQSPRSRVLAAFREVAHGVHDTAAHTRTLLFYRSGGQRWANRT